MIALFALGIWMGLGALAFSLSFTFLLPPPVHPLWLWMRQRLHRWPLFRRRTRLQVEAFFPPGALLRPGALLLLLGLDLLFWPYLLAGMLGVSRRWRQMRGGTGNNGNNGNTAGEKRP